MFKYILTLCFVPFLFLGCNKNSPEYSTREYKDISKDAILNAAKRVIKLSDKDFTISAKKESISAIRAIPKNKGFTVDININELELTTASKNNYTTARLKITQKDDIFSNNQRNITVQLEDLFWDRVDYILGVNKDWYTCAKHRMLLNFDGFFCDINYNTNTYPSPNDIIKDTSIPKPKIIAEDLAVPIAIDLSSMDGIILPFEKTANENEVKVTDINLSTMSEINVSNMTNTIKDDINKTSKKETININDLNITNEVNSTNTLNIDIDANQTIQNVISNNIEKDSNNTNASNEINSTSTNTNVTNADENKTIIADTTNNTYEANDSVKQISSILSDNNQTNITSSEIIDSNSTYITEETTITGLTTPILIDANVTVNFEELKIIQDENSTTQTNIVDINNSTKELPPKITKQKQKQPTSKLNISIPKNDNKIDKLSGFAKKFMGADTNNDYTINLALANSKEESDLFIKKFNIKNETFPIGFKNETGKYFVKIMYGIYKSRDEALAVISKFPKELKLSSPTVEGIHRKQILFSTRGEDLSVK